MVWRGAAIMALRAGRPRKPACTGGGPFAPKYGQSLRLAAPDADGSSSVAG
ncbi:MAG: hypothetical protein QOJ35_3063 [Solirubrobacteraceae bacterium]|nr:hypothetical protein [Solirubrobacteraceae bacterium]